jgi:hypothetical protein
MASAFRVFLSAVTSELGLARDGGERLAGARPEIAGAAQLPPHAGCGHLAALAARLAGAEPLMRLVLAILVDFGRKTRHPHPHRDAALRNYAGLLAAIGKSEADIKAAIASSIGECGARDPPQ